MLKKSGGESLSHQLREIFINNINAGVWKIDTAIPTELQLCKYYDVSRTPVRWALQSLENEGLIYRVRGRGTFVSPPKVLGRVSYAGIRKTIWAANDYKKPTMFKRTKMTANSHISKKLEIEEGSGVIRFERIYNHKDYTKPNALLYSYLPIDIGEQVDHARLGEESLSSLLEAKGIRIESSTEHLAVGIVNAHEEKILKVSKNSPVLIIAEVRRDHKKKPVVYSKYVIRGDTVNLFFSNDE